MGRNSNASNEVQSMTDEELIALKTKAKGHTGDFKEWCGVDFSHAVLLTEMKRRGLLPDKTENQEQDQEDMLVINVKDLPQGKTKKLEIFVSEETFNAYKERFGSIRNRKAFNDVIILEGLKKQIKIIEEI